MGGAVDRPVLGMQSLTPRKFSNRGKMWLRKYDVAEYLRHLVGQAAFSDASDKSSPLLLMHRRIVEGGRERRRWLEWKRGGELIFSGATVDRGVAIAFLVGAGERHSGNASEQY
jgi:hypothetical protein